MLTVAEAAEEVGISRGGIWKAIKTGRLSATKNNGGQIVIDPAELYRVYRPVNKLSQLHEQQPSTESTSKQREVDELTLRLELINKLLARAEGEVDDLRRRLDYEAEERRKLTLLLTHQPQQLQTEKPVKSLLWEKLFGRR
jgi:excisionase family DNA binding protein